MIFKLYGQRKRGWGAKLIGFREVLLATHNIGELHKPHHILRWIFRVFDGEGAGEIPVSKIENIISSLLRYSEFHIFNAESVFPSGGNFFSGKYPKYPNNYIFKIAL